MTAGAKQRQKSALAEAVSHPLRSRCLTILADRAASPAEISRELLVDVGTVGYHVRTLVTANLAEEVSNRQVRGAVEHFYRAVVRPYISTEEEDELGPAERKTFAETTLSLFAANANHALESGSLIERPEHYLARIPLRVDEEGWHKLNEVYAEMFERVYEVQEESIKRLGDQPEDAGIPTLSFLAFFEMPRDGGGK